MSIKAISLVEERTRAKGSNLGVLRSIADYAKDNGKHAFPSPSTLAWKNRLTTRAAELILRKLVDDGEIAPEWDPVERRLYLHIRCLTEWAAYALEGPIPEREKNSSRAVSETYALRLVARAHSRAGKPLSQRAFREKSGVLREKSGPRNLVSLGAAGTCQTQPSGSDQDPVSDPVRERAGAAPRRSVSPEKAPDDNTAVITRVAHEVIDVAGVGRLGDLAESVKARCAQLRIPYTSGVVAKAIDSALWQRTHRAEAR